MRLEDGLLTKPIGIGSNANIEYQISNNSNELQISNSNVYIKADYNIFCLTDDCYLKIQLKTIWCTVGHQSKEQSIDGHMMSSTGWLNCLEYNPNIGARANYWKQTG